MDNKVKVILGYVISPIGLIFYLVDKTASKQERENYVQAATVFICQFAIVILSTLLSSIIPFMGSMLWILNIGIFILAILAAVRFSEGKTFQIPVIYEFSKKIFK